MSFRRIQRKELKKAVSILADTFDAYPLFDMIFKDSKNPARARYYFLLCRLYAMQHYTYLNDDETMAAVCKMPGDSNVPVLGFYLNPFYFLPYLSAVPRHSRKLFREYKKMANAVLTGIYDEKKDIYVEYFGALASFRGKSILKTVMEQTFNGNVYSDTHSKDNFELYRHFGADLIKEIEWYGISVFFFRIKTGETGKIRRIRNNSGNTRQNKV